MTGKDREDESTVWIVKPSTANQGADNTQHDPTLGADTALHAIRQCASRALRPAS